MDQKQLQEYRILNSLFEKDCDRVAKVLKGLERNKGREGSDIDYADEFHLSGDEIDWYGTEYFRGDCEYHSGSFPVAYLDMTDEEIQAIVDKDNEEYRKECEKKRKEEEDKKTAAAWAMYQKLKKQFGE